MIPIKDAVRVNFSAGLDTKTDPKQVDASNFLALNNCTFTTGGQLTKRNGFAGAFSTSTNTPSLTYSAVPSSISSARKIFSYNNELCLLDGWSLYSWDEANTSWIYKGRNTSVNLATQSIVGGANTITQCDSSIDTTTGIKIFSFADALGVYYSIQDIATGQFIVNQAFMGAYVRPRCVSISGKSWVLAVNPANSEIYYQAIVGQTVTGSPTAITFSTAVNNVYTFTVSSASAHAGATYTNNGNTYTVVATTSGATTLLARGSAAPLASGTLTKASGTGDSTITFSSYAAPSIFFDADVDPHTGNIYVAYSNTDEGATIALMSSSMTVTASQDNIFDPPSNGLSWFGDGTNIWVVYNNGTDTSAFIVNNAVTSTVAAATIIDSGSTAANVNNVTGVWSSAFSQAFIFYDPLTTYNSYLFTVSSANASIGATYTNNGNTYTVIKTASSSTMLLVRGMAAPGVSGTLTKASGTGDSTITFSAVSEVGTFTSVARINFNTATLSGSAITPGTPNLFMNTLSINSKAFAVSGIPHLVGLYTYPSYAPNIPSNQQVIQATNFLLNLYNLTSTMGGNSSSPDVIANIAGKISPDEAALIAPIVGYTPGVHLNQGSNWEMALLQSSNYTLESGNTLYSPTGVIDAQFNFSLSNPDVQILGNNALIAGAEVAMYDSASVVEQNFHIYPNAQIVGAVNTSGGNMGLSGANSLYSYIYVYEWIDNQGQVHRSFPSPVITPLAAGESYTFASGTTTGQVELEIPYLGVTNKGGKQVYVNVYRTTANGSIYYLLPNVTLLPGVGNWGTILNEPYGGIQLYLDNFSDADIIGNTELYTTGALGDYAPPATSALTNFKNRCINFASEDEYQIGYSNAVLQNFPVQFVPEFVLNIGTVGGPLVAVAQMDDKMIFFKPGSQPGPAIYYMVGTGPAPSGANNDFTDPLPVAVDAGCVNRASVVLMPEGLMFKSSKGIYLLNRGLQAQYIGAPVQQYNQYDVLSAQLIPNTTQVRFLLEAGATDLQGNAVSMLVYDYYYKRWGTFSAPSGISDCIYQGQHTYVSSTGQVYQETPGSYTDGTSPAVPVTMSFTTSWIKLAGLVGYQRAYFFFLLGEYYSPHQVQLGLYTDYSTTPDTTPSFTPTTDTLENWRVFFAKQRCQAFQIQFKEVYTGTSGQGLNLSGLNLIVGAKNKFRTISAAQSTG